MAKPVVLLIEDNAAEALLVREAFVAVQFDCTVVTIENVVQAYRFLQARAPYEDRLKPDLIVLDVNLPVIKGSDFMREIRRDPEWRRLPVIVLSSSRRDEDIREMAAYGILRYLVKPPVWSQYVDVARAIREEWRGITGAA